MQTSFRLTVRYAVTWRILTELLRRHQAAHDLRVCWSFPGASGHGIVELQRRDGGHLLRLDVAHGEHLDAGLSTRRTGGLDVRRYVDALLAADDPKTIVDAFELSAGLPPRRGPMPVSTAPVLCARVIAAVLERRMLARATYRTTPGYVDADGSVRACGWVEALPAVQAVLAKRRAEAGGAERDERPLARHLFALHRGGLPLDGAEADREPFVAFDLRAGVAHAISDRSMRSSIALDATAMQGGGRLDAAIDWVGRYLPG